MEDNIGVELKPNLDNIPLLARPMLHYTMFGVSPREIMGKAAFNTIKDKVREDCDCHCEICGRVVLHNSQDKDWLYCHEVYQVDKEKKLYTLERYVGICQQCYHYIHTGRLITLSERGKVNRDYFSRVIKKGKDVIQTGQHLNLPDVMERLNPMLRGWANYFKAGNSKQHFKSIDNYVIYNLTIMLRKKHKKSGKGWREHPPSWYYNYFGLVCLRKLSTNINDDSQRYGR
ncbi:group II intron maturase-specific domain-containing protein [Streptococcus agalactiae]